MTKRALTVGEKIKFTGPIYIPMYRVDKSTCEPDEKRLSGWMHNCKAKVLQEPLKNGETAVELLDGPLPGKEVRIHTRQVTHRIVSKPKPQKERGERAVRWTAEYDPALGTSSAESIFRYEGEAQAFAGQLYPKCVMLRRFVECSELETPVSREALESAIRFAFRNSPNEISLESDREHFEKMLCGELGLEAKS